MLLLSQPAALALVVAIVVVPTTVHGEFNTDQCSKAVNGDKAEEYYDENELRGGWNLIPLYYTDDDQVDDIPNTADEIVSGFATQSSYYIGNEKLGSVSGVINRARMCLEDANGRQACQDLSGEKYSFTGELSGFKTRVSSLVKQIATLSGQVPYGATVRGVNGDFVTKGFDGKDGHRSSDIRQWDRDTANWHSWNYGISFYPNSKDNELRYAVVPKNVGVTQEQQDKKTKWTRFYIQLKVSSQTIENAPCTPFVSTTTATATSTTVTTNTLEQAFNELLNGGIQDTVQKHVTELMEAQIKKSEAALIALQKDTNDRFIAMEAKFAAQVTKLQQKVGTLQDEKDGLVNTIDQLANGLVSTFKTRWANMSVAADKAVMPPKATWNPVENSPTVSAADGGKSLELASPKGNVILRTPECPELDLCSTLNALDTFLQQVKSIAANEPGGGGGR